MPEPVSLADYLNRLQQLREEGRAIGFNTDAYVVGTTAVYVPEEAREEILQALELMLTNSPAGRG